MAEKEPTPHDMYKETFDDGKKLLEKVHGEHGNARMAMGEAVKAKYDFTKIDDRKEALECLTTAAIKYRQELKLLPDDEHMTDEMRKDIYNFIVNELDRRGLSTDEILAKFKHGRGAEIIDTITNVYKRDALMNTHGTWYHDKVHAKGGDHVLKMAEGHKHFHKSEEDVGHIATNLKDKMYSRLETELEHI
jgi:hypothetical protein